MNEEKFWQLIESSKTENNDTDAQLEILQEKLDVLSPDEIISFDRIFDKFYWQSYDWKLWAAAYIINGGCSDDGFDYFRAGLILQGEKVFRAALTNPESLVNVIKFEDGDLAENSYWSTGVEEFIYLASQIYEDKKGAAIPASRDFSIPRDPAGETWEEDAVEELLPKLAKYCDEGMN